VIDGGDGVLPDELLGWDLRAEIAYARTHIAVGKFVPGPSKRIRELVRVLEKASRDLLVNRVEPQGEVGGEHRGRVMLRGVVRVRHRALAA